MSDKLIRLVIFIFALAVLAAPAAEACPMCQAANEDGRVEGFDGPQAMTTVPRAYMYSILFMMAVPVTLLASFAIGFYRLSKRAADPDVAIAR